MADFKRYKIIHQNKITAKDLVKITKGRLICGSFTSKIKGISFDSREIVKGDLFIAISGEEFDGHNYIDQAIKKGASAVILEKDSKINRKNFKKYQKEVACIKVNDSRHALSKMAAYIFGNPEKKLKIIGITGTNGKTTTLFILEKIFRIAGFNPGIIGTVSYKFADVNIPALRTTPDAITLQYLFHKMLQKKVDYVIMEISSHALDQERITGVNLKAAIFTNLTAEHLDYHRNLNNYFLSKAKLFKSLNRSALAVINLDSSYGRKLIPLTSAKILTYSINSESNIGCEIIKMGFKGLEILIKSKKKSISIKSRLIGRHNVYNILAASTLAMNLGIKPKFIKLAIESFSFVPGRLEYLRSNLPYSIFIDYAHTPDALKKVLFSLRRLTSGKLIVVFGCGGQRDKAKRPRMGNIATRLSDYVIITNDNPRYESPQDIIEDIKFGIKKKNYEVILDRKSAIKRAISIAEPKDTILIAGKGHERFQIINDRALPFCDKDAIKDILKYRKIQS